MEEFLKKKNIFNLLLLGIMVLAVPITIKLVRQQQILFSHAAETKVEFLTKDQGGTTVPGAPDKSCVVSRGGNLVSICNKVAVRLTAPTGSDIKFATPVPAVTSAPTAVPTSVPTAAPTTAPTTAPTSSPGGDVVVAGGIPFRVSFDPNFSTIDGTGTINPDTGEATIELNLPPGSGNKPVFIQFFENGAWVPVPPMTTTIELLQT